MSPIEPTPQAPHHDRLHRLFPLLLVVILPLAPPETRGEGMAGAALCIATLLALRVGPVARTWLPLPLLAGGLLYFPATLLAEAPGAAVEPLGVWLLAAAAAASTATLDRDQRTRPELFAVLSVTACLAAVHGLCQTLWGLDALAEAIRVAPPGADREVLLARVTEGRAFAAFSTPAALGGFLVLVLPVTAGLGLAASGRRRWLWLAAGTTQIAGLLATASLSAGLALAAASLLWGLRSPALRKRLWLPVGLALGVLVVIVALRGAEVAGASGAGHPLRLRGANFRLALEVLTDHPWTGVGPGGFGEVYPQYRRAGDNEAQHVHDLPLELCAEWGLPAGLLGAGIFFWVFLGPLLRTPGDEPPWARGAAVGLAALALQGLLDFAVLLPSLLWISAVLRGWIGRRSLACAPGPTLVPALAVCGVVAAAALAASGGLAWNVRLEARQRVAAGQTAEAERLARRATRLAPWNPDGWLYRAQIVAGPQPSPSLAAERVGEAREAVERAVALSPVRPAARMTRALLRAVAGDLPGAYADASAAARFYPLRTEYAAARDELGRRLATSVADAP